MAVDPSRVKEIFLAVTELPDEAARSEFLDNACGTDADLRSRVETLLRSHEPAGDFLATPAVSLPHGVQDDTVDREALSGIAGTSSIDAEASDDFSFLKPATRPDSLGRIGHYEVLQVLGKGAFGIVFRAFDDVLQRVVAVKVMAPQIATTSPARKRFLREARTSAQVRHENVVQVYEVGEQPLPYLVMEFIPGETLQERLARTGPLDVLETVRIGRQIAEGLAAAHATDLIHRDIKPGNVLIESGKLRAKITDFGLARAADDASISQSGIIAGTPMYMAPEQALGQTLDQRADLFSLGSVLYQMVSGRPPFRANGTVAVLKRVADDTPRPIREITPETPQWLCDIISKLHAKNPSDRYQSAREVADVLGDCEEQLKANSKLKDFSRIPRQSPIRRPAGGTAWKVGLAVVALAAIALVGTEWAGVTHLFRTAAPTVDPNKPGVVTFRFDDPAIEFQIDDIGANRFGTSILQETLTSGQHSVWFGLGDRQFRTETFTVRPGERSILELAVTDDGGHAKRNGHLLNVKPEPRPARAANPAPIGAPPTVTALRPVTMKSLGGATLTRLDDDSILASGDRPDTDIYTVAFRDLPAKIDSIRLDVLTDPSLPREGPGREPEGSFVLTAVRAELDVPGNPAKTRALPFVKATTDFSRGDDSRVEFAIDADDKTGWVSEVGKSHFATFSFAQTLAIPEGAILRVILEFKHEEPQQTLGRFRVSACRVP